MNSFDIKEKELYQELDLIENGIKIGEAEIDIKNRMLSRLNIFPEFQNKGYGKQIVDILNKIYGCKSLWVESDNERAIHVYKKNGYKIVKPTMFLMERVI